MKKLLSILVFLAVLTLSSCAHPEIPGIDRPLAQNEHGYLGMQWLRHINDYLPSRLPFSDRELEAAEWIRETLLEMGFDRNQIEMQTFSYHDDTTSWWGGNTTRMVAGYELLGFYNELELLYYSQNVILTIPGYSTETIIIGAHYDSVGFPGISDNAGGIVLLLENAYRTRDIKPYYTLQYVFFGAEEVGLIGSFHFADMMSQEEIDNLLLMINADSMMDGPDLIYAIAYFDELPPIPSDILRPEDDPLRLGIMPSQNSFTGSVERIAARIRRHYNTELISMPHAITLGTDHVSFFQFATPAMVFYSTHLVNYPEVAPDDARIIIPDMFIGDVWHTERDCLDFIMANHPGRIERALNQFGVFLEEVVSGELVERSPMPASLLVVGIVGVSVIGIAISFVVVRKKQH